MLETAKYEYNTQIESTCSTNLSGALESVVSVLRCHRNCRGYYYYYYYYYYALTLTIETPGSR